MSILVHLHKISRRVCTFAKATDLQCVNPTDTFIIVLRFAANWRKAKATNLKTPRLACVTICKSMQFNKPINIHTTHSLV